MSGGTGPPAPPRPARRRPNALRWWWYAQGGRRPGAHREWVLHDLTCRGWWLRHLTRSSVQLVPVVIVLVVLIPGPFWIRGLAVMFGVLTGLYFALVYMVETTEHRALKAGYPLGTAQQIRDERRAAQRISRAQRYGLSWAPRPPPETPVHHDDALPAPLALVTPLAHGPDRLPLRRPGGPDAAGPGGALRAPARWRSHRSPARTSIRARRPRS